MIYKSVRLCARYRNGNHDNTSQWLYGGRWRRLRRHDDSYPPSKWGIVKKMVFNFNFTFLTNYSPPPSPHILHLDTVKNDGERGSRHNDEDRMTPPPSCSVRGREYFNQYSRASLSSLHGELVFFPCTYDWIHKIRSGKRHKHAVIETLRCHGCCHIYYKSSCSAYHSHVINHVLLL